MEEFRINNCSINGGDEAYGLFSDNDGNKCFSGFCFYYSGTATSSKLVVDGSGESYNTDL